MLSDIGIVMRFGVVVVVVVLSCVLVGGDAKKVRCIGREREALLSFKNGLIDDDGVLSSWRGEECCNWYGVECSNTTGNIIGLRLHGAVSYSYSSYDNDYDHYQLRGKISPSLLDLRHLTYLDLSGNDFEELPEFIGSMKQLQHLYLAYCSFSGDVPPHLGNLTNLRTLDLSYNDFLSFKNLNWLSSLSPLSYLDFSASFLINHPKWLQQILNLRSLKELHLKACSISDDSVSAGLIVNSSSTSLSTLDLSYNGLTSLPLNWLSNVSSSLVKIDLSWNELSGPIPDAFGRFVHLEFLDVSYNMLEGEIPKSLGNLPHLRVLVFYDNKLSGQLDELVGNLSTTEKLASLEIVDLAENQLTGSVPDLTPFSSLTEVYLGSNKLTGTLPLSVGQLAKLRVLEISNNNNLEGNFSESHFIKLHNLKTLDLSSTSLKMNIASNWIPPFQLENMLLEGCNVGPSFPKWIRTQTNLSFLHLSNASIVDQVPSWLWTSFPLLEYLILSHNQISGTIPDLSSIPLEYIDVSDNKFSGLIPLFHPNTTVIYLSRNMFFGSISSICRISHDRLYSLSLSNNQLSGEIPNCWEKFPHLVFLDLANNRFVGIIPHSLRFLPDLSALHLENNKLSGELPSTLRFCQFLILMNVGGNKLTGEIPTWLGEIHSLQILNLGSNRFHGNIPSGICNLTRIKILDIHMNNLSGKITDCFNYFAALADKNALFPSYSRVLYYIVQYNALLPYKKFKTFMEYASIVWKGQESEYTKNLYLLRLVDFSSNRLTGNIPQSVSNMRGLISLNLSRNILTGNIIPDIGQMEMLEVLDLSNNQLSGEIPRSMAQLHFLSDLDLSNNNLSGEIPSSTQLQSFDASSYAGNTGLCGHPLTLCPGDIPRQPTTAIARGEKGDVFSRLSFMQGLCISIAFGFIFGFWGLIGSFIVKKSWRYAFFNLMDAAGDWLYVRYMKMKQFKGLC